MAMLLKGLLAVFFLMVIPVLAGGLFFNQDETYSIAKAYTNGYLCLFALAELLILPCVFLQTSLTILTILYGICASLFAFVGILRCKQTGVWSRKQKLWNAHACRTRDLSEYLFLLVAFGIIFVQFVTVVRFHRPDADDSQYVAAAVTDLYDNSVFHLNPNTGAVYKHFPARYVLSPFPDFLAINSKLCGSLHPAILAHTVFPVVFGILAYTVQWMFAKKWFPGKKQKQSLYLCFIAFLISFSCVSVYNAGTFQMIRLWQGKALLAAAVIPALVYTCVERILEHQGKLGFLVLTGLACCLPSSMGVILSGIVFGTFFLLALVFRKGFRSCIDCVIGVLPVIFMGGCYLFLR